MTPEELQELKEKAELWDSLSDSLKGIYASQFKYGATTIQNTSNASSHIDVLEEEVKDMICERIDVKCTNCGSSTKVLFPK